MSTRRNIERSMDELGDRARHCADDANATARDWIARGRRAAGRFDGEGYQRRLARAAEDFVDETNYRYRRLKRQVNRHPVATATIVAGAIGAFLLLRRALRSSDEE
ncbi:MULTISPECIES: hypothetical protein [Rhodanobacter]|uniref:DUF883 domain-containing protein n=1 Tax=Rhodanobacter hydrolyticus TaxID=2250595 RepID=A0ABW8J7W3_9GAMM|nr:hypothetical protein [Rhodanobacter sp. 7MK24]MBD8881395.1 hypothetical protein [Rhodanobacter sp. 7MK24]